VPNNFKQWVVDNEERIAAARERGTEPYFLRDTKGSASQLLSLYKKPLERIINHCSNAEEISVVKYDMNNVEVLRYRRTRQLGDNKDMSAPKDKKNLQRKRKRGVEEYIEYEFEYSGVTWLLGMERHVANFEQPYYIYKK
jgi:hypothetical protein